MNFGADYKMKDEKKRVLFDLTALEPNATGSRFHGAAEYAKNVLWCLTGQYRELILDCFYKNDNTPEICNGIISNRDRITYIKISSNKDITDILALGHYHIFYSALPYGYSDLEVPKDTKFIYTVHGMRVYEKAFDWDMLYYDTFSPGNLLHYLKSLLSCKKRERQYADKIDRLFSITDNRCVITVSEHSKYSILSACKNIREDEIKVLHAPTGIGMDSEKGEREKDGCVEKWGVEKGKYFLLISSNRWIKNCYRAVRAFDRLFDEKPDVLKGYQVVLLGITDKCSFVKKIKNKDKFVLVGYVEDGELKEAYRKAYAFVYPTLNEGYGYPPIESMKCNTVCISSAVSSIMEVCRDAVCYFNPYDRKEIMNRIYQMLNQDIREEYLQRGKKRYQEVTELQKRDLLKLCGIIAGSE